MLELKTMNAKAHEWLNKIPVEHWARSHFLGRYGVSILALTKDHKGKKINTPYPEEVNMMYCMTRSSTNELFTPYKELELEFQSSKRHFKTQPKIKDKDNFELKGQFLKELRTNTFSGSDHEDANEHIKKVLKIVDLFYIPNITINQVMLRAFPMSLTGAASQWLRNKPTSSIITWEDLKTKMEEINNFQQEQNENLYQAWERFKELLMKCPRHYLVEIQEVVLSYNGLDIPTRQILDSRGAIPSKTVVDVKTAIQEMAEYSQKWHNGTLRVRSTKTSDGLAAMQAQLNSLGREIKKVKEKVYVAQVGCNQCKGPHYTKDHPLKEEGKTLEEAYYMQLMEDTLIKFMGESTKRHEENSNLIKEIRASTNASIRNQVASIKTLEIQIGQISKVLQERGFGSLPSSTEANPRDQVKSISTIVEANSYPIRPVGSSQYAVSTGQNRTLMYETRQMTIPFPSRASVSVMPLSTYLNLGLGELAHTKLIVELADRTVKYPKGIAKNVLVGIRKFTFTVDFIILDMPEDIKVPLILGRPFLSTARAKIDVYKRKITLRVGEERIIFTSVKPASSLIKRVYMLSLRERMELDLEARLMGENLVLNRSLEPFLEDYFELNDLNEPFELRRQGDDLMPTIE
ncbi:DNA-directed DNA polymerase [Tanacetum coccineum]